MNAVSKSIDAGARATQQVVAQAPARRPCLGCRELIQEAVKAEHARATADEIAFLDSCFADDGSKTPKAKLARIARMASCRLALLIAHGPVRVRRDDGNDPKPAVPDASAGSRTSDVTPDHSDFFFFEDADERSAR